METSNDWLRWVQDPLKYQSLWAIEVYLDPSDASYIRIREWITHVRRLL